VPEDYYLALNKLILDSKFRINMSALYIGTGKKEKFLLDRINSKLESNKDIKVNILVDYMRGTRENRKQESTKSMLAELCNRNSNHKFLRCGLFHQPYKTRVLSNVTPSVVHEVLGVHHIKAHVFDNNVLITGANLSEDYFTNRQDRCYIIRESPHVANYFDDLLNTLTNNSFHVTNDLGLELQKYYPNPKIKVNEFKNVLSHQIKLFRYSNKTNVHTGQKLTADDYFFGNKDEARPLLANGTENG